MLSRTTDKSHKRLFARMLAQEMTLSLADPDSPADPAGGTTMLTSTSPSGDEDGTDYAND